MAWIEFHDDIWEHHKTERLSDLLGLPIVYTVGHLASLWHFTLRNAWRDADLAPWGEKGIERGARWVGDPGKFVAAARECGFLDGTIVHGWMDRAGKLVQDRLYNEQRRKNVDLRRKADATVHNPTVHNPTVPTDIAPRLENPSVTPPKTFLTFRCAGTPDEWTLTEAKLAVKGG